MATIQFLGATGTVTGSKYVLEVGGSRAMVDCGLFQGFKELRERNWEPLPVNPASIGWALVTHAHIDHTGYLPRLVRDGFTGPVYATSASADLMKIMLTDSGRIQEEDAEYANRKGFSKHKPAVPLYTEQDAVRALKQVQPVPYGEDVRLSKFMTARFIPSGHILGSSFIEFQIAEPDRGPLKVVFSGDVGRYDEPILNDPAAIGEADYLLVESTYGNRLHDPTNPKERLAEIINETAARGGKVIIPAFAVGRTQLLVYYLRELEDEGRIPVLPVAVDSPMGAQATRLYSKHKEDHDLDMQRIDNLKRNPLATRNFSLVQGRGGSKALDADNGPAIIISASGMATGGRVLHHLAHYLPDPRSSVIFVGYQGAGTRGRRLQDGEKEVKIHGEMVKVNAHIESISSLSAHADAAEILRWLGGFKRPPRTTFIIHGEPDSAEALRDKIVKELGWEVMIPAYKQVVEL
ncbi:MAG TPA: MBL fold metallo-hydrolase [Blastocatellia bacterium]|jgi:metallo-beta-lactamase family protein|nr:MBL fold metallo-hydrolase [Blastocatellia bacterium]